MYRNFYKPKYSEFLLFKKCKKVYNYADVKDKMEFVLNAKENCKTKIELIATTSNNNLMLHASYAFHEFWANFIFKSRRKKEKFFRNLA